jgi:hypothetical protein
MKPGPKPLLGTTMTRAQRQARYRASHTEAAAKPRYRNPPLVGAGHSGGVMP